MACDFLRNLQSALRWSALWIVIGVACYFALPYLAGLRAGLLEDDSYFYAQIAFNWPRYGTFTFDGLDPTSGFHLLWGALLSALSALLLLFTNEKTIHLSAYLALWFLIIWRIAERVGRSRSERWTFLGLALLTAALMEMALLTLLLIELQARIDQEASEPAHKSNIDWLAVGISIAIPLTRIDATPILLVWLCTLRERRRLLLSVSLGLAMGLASHIVLLSVIFGHPYTVSSLLKTQSVHGLRALRSLADVGIFIRTAVTILAASWGATRLHQRCANVATWARFGAPLAFTLTHLALSDMRSWYFLPGMAFGFWAGTAGSPGLLGMREHLGKLERGAWWAIVCAASMLTMYKAYRFVPLDHVRSESWKFVAAARDQLPVGSRIYQVDGSGFTAYWIDRNLINGDGLVNTYEYARRMKARRLGKYLNEKLVCYLITDAPGVDEVGAALVSKGGLRVREEQVVEVLRSGAYGWSHNTNAHFVLWRLMVSRCGGQVAEAR